MSKYKPKVGDRVKVVLEGEVSYVEPDARESYFAITASHDRLGRDQTGILPDRATVVSIEKVEPPVVTFKPGDAIRLKNAPANPIRILAKDGYLNLSTLRFISTDYAGQFTSEYYELVEL